MERMTPVDSEWKWYVAQDYQPVAHNKYLPDYCYNIFEKFGRTLLKAFPKFSDTITVIGDIKQMALWKTIEEVKRNVRIDWLRMGSVVGIGKRGQRYVEMEAEGNLKREGLLDFVPEKGEAGLGLIFEKSKLPTNQEGSGVQGVGRILEQQLKEDTASQFEIMTGKEEYFRQVAYLWGPEALADFNKAMARGLKRFLDEDGEMVGKSVRANIYEFLLIAWPEIKEMLEAKPRKTVRDLHRWMLPFMRHGMTSLIDVETLRDVCGPLPGGIGLKLRPLSSR